MLDERENELLSRIGPGTPAGDLQRRYWHVIGAVEEMAGRWTKRVRLLGEDLVLFKDRRGTYGLIAEQCPHRRASLFYGIPQQDGIRCPYHGWKFDAAGRCVDQPNEPEGSTFKEKCSTPAYPVEALGGLLWGYLGPQPAPLLPRWDGFAGDATIRFCSWHMIDCNWLQIMENSMDPIHTEWLHGALLQFLFEKEERRFAIARKHLKIDFSEFEYGIYKRRLLEGSSEDSDDWRVGHPVLFPNILAVGSGGGRLWKFHSYQIRVPVDDEHTMHYRYLAFEPPQGKAVPAHLLERVPFFELPARDENGAYLLGQIPIQDQMAWETQGPIAKRELEHLGTTDRGVILFRQMLQRELKKVENGEDPLGTVRDPLKNELIEFAIEKDKVHFTDGFDNMMKLSPAKYSPFANELREMFAEFNGPRVREPAAAR